jgi:hypothetical protein
MGFELGKPTEVSRYVASEGWPLDQLPTCASGVDESIGDSR